MAELRKLPHLSLSDLQVSSEAEAYAILLAFDMNDGPGGTCWKAGEPGEQTITATFREPCRLAEITMEVEEQEVARTQEVQLALSTDGGHVPRGRASGIQLQPGWNDMGERDMESTTRSSHRRAISYQTRQRAE